MPAACLLQACITESWLNSEEEILPNEVASLHEALCHLPPDVLRLPKELELVVRCLSIDGARARVDVHIHVHRLILRRWLNRGQDLLVSKRRSLALAGMESAVEDTGGGGRGWSDHRDVLRLAGSPVGELATQKETSVLGREETGVGLPQEQVSHHLLKGHGVVDEDLPKQGAERVKVGVSQLGLVLRSDPEGGQVRKRVSGDRPVSVDHRVGEVVVSHLARPDDAALTEVG